MSGGEAENPPLYITSLQCMDFLLSCLLFVHGGEPNISRIRIFHANEMEFRVLPLRYSELVQVTMYCMLHVTSSGIIAKHLHVCLVIF